MAGSTPFQKEAWTEYGIGTVVLFLRIVARIKVVGVKNWQGDDYFTLVALVFWTVGSISEMMKTDIDRLLLFRQS